jgi:hypothetical protein
MSEEKSLIEKVATHPATQVAMTLVAVANPAVAAGALLPVLTGALGYIEAERRIKAWNADVDARLRLMSDHLNRFSEAQWRLTIGIIQTAQSTVEQEKLRMLKAAVLNVAGSDYIEHFEAQEFTRILRDASAADIAFLAQHRGVREFTFHQGGTLREGLVRINLDGSENSIARNLITLGILTRSPDEGTAADVGAYLVAPFVPSLLRLIEDTPVASPPP